MTQLALVVNQLEVVSDFEIDPTPALNLSSAEKAVVAEYVKYLKSKGFCKLDDASSNSTRLFNRYAKQPQSMSYIANNFQKWLHSRGLKCRTPTLLYITRKLDHVVGSQFVPNGGDYWTDEVTGYTYANTYRQYKPTTDCTELSPLFMQFLERLVHVDIERGMLLQWLAHMFQKPAERPSFHYLLTSAAGTGKGFLLQKILHPLLHHTQLINNFARLTDKFSTTLEDNLFVLLDDAKARTDVTQTTLKSMLSEERAYVERKQLQGGMVNTYTRFFLASNEQVPLEFDKEERRWVPLTRAFHSVSKEETQEHIKKLSDWLDLPGSMDAVYRFFMSYDLTGFNHKSAPQTVTLLEMIRKGRGLQNEIFNDFIADKEVFTFLQLKAEFVDQGFQPPTAKALTDLLHDAGYKNSQRRIPGDRIRVCHPIGMSKITLSGLLPKIIAAAATVPVF